MFERVVQLVTRVTDVVGGAFEEPVHPAAKQAKIAIAAPTRTSPELMMTPWASAVHRMCLVAERRRPSNAIE